MATWHVVTIDKSAELHHPSQGILRRCNPFVRCTLPIGSRFPCSFAAWLSWLIYGLTLALASCFQSLALSRNGSTTTEEIISVRQLMHWIDGQLPSTVSNDSRYLAPFAHRQLDVDRVGASMESRARNCLVGSLWWIRSLERTDTRRCLGLAHNLSLDIVKEGATPRRRKALRCIDLACLCCDALDDDGVLDQKTTASHPWPSDGVLRKEYLQLGEIGFVDRYASAARTAIAADPWNFCTRVARRFLAATLWYQSHDRDENLVWPTRFKRVVFPLPIAAVLLLIASGIWKRRRTATVLAV